MGSDVALVDMAKRAIVDDEEELHEGDIDNMASRRFEKTGGRHKISGSTQERRGSHGVIDVSKGTRDAMGGKLDENIMKAVYGYDKKPDHTPHELFVQMDELEGDKWVERARWIKYEEDLEQGAGR